jgi:hypothetical protein
MQGMTWQDDHLHRLAKRMVALETYALRAEAHDDQATADELWRRRESVQWQRSLFLRDIWASTPRESSLVKQ